MGFAMAVRILCINGASRANLGDSHLFNVKIQRFLARTHLFVNPLQYSEDLTLHEARSWLQSERLRRFPRFEFEHRGTDACDLIESALVWHLTTADLFPKSSRQCVRSILSIPWSSKRLTTNHIVYLILPFVIDRW